ncbi:MAG: flavin reductase family protein [Nitrospinota bacterium]|nr:flavin reductase family protein [Nitrospinota bacterium]
MSDYYKINASDNDFRQNYRLMVGTIVPRPIAWVSSISKDGHANLAPFSFFTCVGQDPPLVSISVGKSPDSLKDTTNNILETKGYVIHVVANGFEEQMNITSDNFAFDIDEFKEAGLNAVPSENVLAPRVENIPVSMECEFRHMITNGNSHKVNLIIGEVLCWHVRKDVAMEEGKYIDHLKLEPVGRLAGNDYCRTQDTFVMQRPDRKEGQQSP